MYIQYINTLYDIDYTYPFWLPKTKHDYVENNSLSLIKNKIGLYRELIYY